MNPALSMNSQDPVIKGGAKRPALYILIPLCAGIALPGIFNISILCSILSAAVFLVISLFFFRSRAVSQAALFLAILFTGAALSLNSNLLPADHISNFIPSEEPSDLSLRGKVIDDPIATTTLYKTVRTSFTLKAESLKEGASWRKTCGLVKADIFSKNAQTISFGDELLLEGAASRPHGLNNPGLFNYAEYLKLKNIYCCLTVKDGSAAKVLRRDSTGYIKSAAYRVRHRMRTLINEYLKMPYSGFLKAILIGDRSDLKDKIKNEFVKTGTVHILAISGLHVGLIAAVFLAIFAFCRVPRKANLALTTMLLIFYSFVAGSNPPIIRAVIMFAIYSAGYLINRDTDTLNSLSIAALAILLANPKELHDPGFQLSFVSVASIVIFTPRLNVLFSSIMPVDRLQKRWKRVYAYITGGISVSVAAWLGSFPVIAAYFNMISPVSVIANLIIIPMLFLLIAASFPFFAFSFISVPVAAGIAQGLQLTEKLLFSINGFLANIPFAFFRLAMPSPGFTFLYYALISLLIIPPYIELDRIKISRTRIAIIILIFFNILVLPSALRSSPDGLKMTVLDVGQGDSIFMQFPDGNILIDGGPGGKEDTPDMGESVIAPFLWNRRIRTIDVLVVTHFHADHAGGILYVLKNFNIGCVIDNGTVGTESEMIYREYLRLIKAKHIRRISAEEGDIIRAFKDSEIFVLNPEKYKILSDSNDNSLVLKLRYRNYYFLLCGDIKDRAMSRLIQYGNFLRSDVMKVPHHGGALGNTKVVTDFFKLISPAISVISVGTANRYNMPSGKTVDIIAGLQTKSYMTKDGGAIEIYTDNRYGGLMVETTKEN